MSVYYKSFLFFSYTKNFVNYKVFFSPKFIHLHMCESISNENEYTKFGVILNAFKDIMKSYFLVY